MGASKTVESQEECAQFCSAMDGCNAASYYIDAELVGGSNCWLKNANFEASMETSSCVLPDDASTDANAVLLFLVDGTCAPPLQPPYFCCHSDSLQPRL